MDKELEVIEQTDLFYDLNTEVTTINTDVYENSTDPCVKPAYTVGQALDSCTTILCEVDPFSQQVVIKALSNLFKIQE